MDNKKILIVSVLAIFVIAMSLSAVSASSCKKHTFKINKETKIKKLKNNDKLQYIYEKKDYPQLKKGVTVTLTYDGIEDPRHSKLVKATVYFKKGKKVKKVSSSKVKGKTTIYFKLIKSYKPYKVDIYYK